MRSDATSDNTEALQNSMVRRCGVIRDVRDEQHLAGDSAFMLKGVEGKWKSLDPLYPTRPLCESDLPQIWSKRSK